MAQLETYHNMAVKISWLVKERNSQEVVTNTWWAKKSTVQVGKCVVKTTKLPQIWPLWKSGKVQRMQFFICDPEWSKLQKTNGLKYFILYWFIYVWVSLSEISDKKWCSNFLTCTFTISWLNIFIRPTLLLSCKKMYAWMAFHFTTIHSNLLLFGH